MKVAEGRLPNIFFGLPWDQFGLTDRTAQHCSKKCKKGGVPQKRNPSSGTCKIKNRIKRSAAPASAFRAMLGIPPSHPSQCNSKGSIGCVWVAIGNPKDQILVSRVLQQSLPKSRSGKLLSVNTFGPPKFAKCAQKLSMMFRHVHDIHVDIDEFVTLQSELTPMLWPSTCHGAPYQC
jgi:hypothetical protein